MKTIKLSEPRRFGDVSISEITLLDPKFGDFVDLGFPVTWVAVRDGGGFEQESPQVIRDWVERLFDGDPNVLESLNLRDTLALRDAVVDFFREARMEPGPMKSSDQSPAL